MRIRSFSPILALRVFIFVAVIIGMPVGATQVVPLTFEETVRQAGTIAVGTVTTSGQSRWGDASRRWMLTDYIFTVDDVLYDAEGSVAVGKTIVLTYWGGTINDETHRIADTRLPALGEPLIVMLRPDWRERNGATPTVGFNQGLFEIQEEQIIDADGHPLALFSDGSIVRETEIPVGVAAPGVTLATFSEWIRANLKSIKAKPSTVDPPAADPPNDHPLFGKSPASPQSLAPVGAAPPLEDVGAIAVPDASPENVIVPATMNAIAASRGGKRGRIASQYSSFGQAYAPIVVNAFPPSFAPWSPEDQYQMSKWNYYASNLFRVYTTSSGTFAWPDGIFDLDGWVSSATMASVYGFSWDSNTIAVCISRFDGSGRIVEADIAFNPAFSYTLNDESVYNGSSAQGFRQVMLHELGHMHGLNHNFSFLSVMNYFPSVYRMFGLPYMDDAEGIRAEYPGNAVSLTDLAVYLYYGSGYQSVSAATHPFSVTAGNSFVVDNYHVENVGTTTISTPTIEWYLSGARNFNSTYYYLGSTTYGSLPRFHYFDPSTVDRTLNVPGNVPSGSYYLGAFIRNDSGAGQGSFPFNNNMAFSRSTIFVSGTTTCSSFSISPSSANPNAASGSQGVTITGSPSGCQGGSWSTSGNGSWITVSPSSGSGSGSATVSWSQNTSASSRSGNATIAGQTFTVNQAGAQPPVCTSFQINPSSANPAAAAGSQGVTITGSPSGCQGGSWSTSGNGSWITVSPSSGSGSGSATVSWSQNTSASSRSGNATIAGQTFTVNQASAQQPVCTSFQINPSSANPTSAAGSQAVTVSASPAGCQGGSWSTSGNGSWITVSPNGGSGPGSATVFWTQNTSAASRSGNATIAGNTFSVQQAGTGATVRVRGDLNADGRADIFWRKADDGQNSIWFMNGATSPNTMLLTPVALSWAPSLIGDFDGDGRADVWWRSAATGETSVWLGWNGSTFATQVRSLTVATAWVPRGSGDFNGDGKTDIFWQNASTGQTSIWFMNGAMYSSTASTTTVPVLWTPGPFGDFDGDGKCDVFWRNPSTSQTSIWLGWNGSAFTTQLASIAVPSTWASVAAGDINGDGKADLFWRNASTGQTSIWFMNGATYSSTAMATTVPMPWTSGPLGDFDGDGKADVFWRNPSTGETSVWLGWNGTTFVTQVRSLTAPPNWAPISSP